MSLVFDSTAAFALATQPYDHIPSNPGKPRLGSLDVRPSVLHCNKEGFLHDLIRQILLRNEALRQRAQPQCLGMELIIRECGVAVGHTVLEHHSRDAGFSKM